MVAHPLPLLSASHTQMPQQTLPTTICFLRQRNIQCSIPARPATAGATRTVASFPATQAQANGSFVLCNDQAGPYMNVNDLFLGHLSMDVKYGMPLF